MLSGHLLDGSLQTNWTFLAMVGGLLLGQRAIDHAKRTMDLRNAAQLRCPHAAAHGGLWEGEPSDSEAATRAVSVAEAMRFAHPHLPTGAHL